MSAFEDNPFAEDDGETTFYSEITSRKRSRCEQEEEEDVNLELNDKYNLMSDSLLKQQKLDIPMTDIPSSNFLHNVSNIDNSNFLQNENNINYNDENFQGEILSTSSLLADYDAGREEDEFNALVVRAAGLESELKKQENKYMEEEKLASKENENLRISIGEIMETIVQIREEIDSFRNVQNQIIESNSSNNNNSNNNNNSSAAIELLEVIQRISGALQEKSIKLSQSLTLKNKENIINSTLSDCINSSITENLNNIPEITSLELNIKERYDKVKEISDAVIRVEGLLGNIFPIVQALVSELEQLLTRYNSTCINSKLLLDRIIRLASALHNLSRDSLEWYTRSANKAICSNNNISINNSSSSSSDSSGGGGGAVLSPNSIEVYEGMISNQQLESTLHYMESILNQLISPNNNNNNNFLSRQNTPSIAIVSALALEKELESHTESLGYEVLTLREMLATDTATLLQSNETLENKNEINKKEFNMNKKIKSLMMLAQTLQKRITNTDTLLHSLYASEKSRRAPAIDLKLSFYHYYIEMQEALLRALCTLNTSLTERVQIVNIIRRLALHDGDSETATMLAEKLLLDSSTDISKLHETFKETCTLIIRQFADETSGLFRELTVSAGQGLQQIQEVRKLFAQTLETMNHIIINDLTLTSISHSFLDTPLMMSSENIETKLEINFETCNEKFLDLIKMVEVDHKEELKEEINFAQHRNEELEKCIKWLSMQVSHSAIPQLRIINKEINEVKQQLEISKQNELNFMELKNDVETTQQEILETENYINSMKTKINEFRERLSFKDSELKSYLFPEIS